MKKTTWVFYYKNMANFQAFLQGIKLSANLLFLQSDVMLYYKFVLFIFTKGASPAVYSFSRCSLLLDPCKLQFDRPRFVHRTSISEVTIALCTIFIILLTFFGKFCNAHTLHASGVYYSYMISGHNFEFRKIICNFWHPNTCFQS